MITEEQFEQQLLLKKRTQSFEASKPFNNFDSTAGLERRSSQIKYKKKSDSTSPALKEEKEESISEIND